MNGTEDVFILFSTEQNNQTHIEAETTDRRAAERWSAHFGHHFETYVLNDLSEVRWATESRSREQDGGVM